MFILCVSALRFSAISLNGETRYGMIDECKRCRTSRRRRAIDPAPAGRGRDALRRCSSAFRRAPARTPPLRSADHPRLITDTLGHGPTAEIPAS